MHIWLSLLHPSFTVLSATDSFSAWELHTSLHLESNGINATSKQNVQCNPKHIFTTDLWRDSRQHSKTAGQSSQLLMKSQAEMLLMPLYLGQDYKPKLQTQSPPPRFGIQVAGSLLQLEACKPCARSQCVV